LPRHQLRLGLLAHAHIAHHQRLQPLVRRFDDDPRHFHGAGLAVRIRNHEIRRARVAADQQLREYRPVTALGHAQQALQVLCTQLFVVAPGESLHDLVGVDNAFRPGIDDQHAVASLLDDFATGGLHDASRRPAIPAARAARHRDHALQQRAQRPFPSLPCVSGCIHVVVKSTESDCAYVKYRSSLPVFRRNLEAAHLQAAIPALRHGPPTAAK
jgi:hypothetical protein